VREFGKDIFSGYIDEHGIHADCPIEETAGTAAPTTNVPAPASVALAKEARTALAAAMRTARAPLADRLRTLLALHDDADFQAELVHLRKDLPSLFAKMNSSKAADAATAELEGAMAAALFNAIGTARAHKTVNREPLANS
jgi:hypothetical protein